MSRANITKRGSEQCGMKTKQRVRLKSPWIAMIAVLFGAIPCHARNPEPLSCEKVELTGEVSAGHEWKSPIGEGWVFRMVPIVPGPAGYSGWDLVIDRIEPAGFPDALLLATLPYNSLNQREVGTTFGLRAQDAVGWNPRSFRFLSSPAAFHEGQQLFRSLSANHPGNEDSAQDAQRNSADARALARLLELQKKASPGEFRIIDARLVPGIGDAAPYALNWALASARTPHQVESALSGKSSSAGSLNWIRFSVTLWLPKAFKVPAELHSAQARCSE